MPPKFLQFKWLIQAGINSGKLSESVLDDRSYVQAVGKENLMVKVPATEAGIPGMVTPHVYHVLCRVHDQKVPGYWPHFP